jgi:hypothetical protein
MLAQSNDQPFGMPFSLLQYRLSIRHPGTAKLQYDTRDTPPTCMRPRALCSFGAAGNEQATLFHNDPAILLTLALADNVLVGIMSVEDL